MGFFSLSLGKRMRRRGGAFCRSLLEDEGNNERGGGEVCFCM